MPQSTRLLGFRNATAILPDRLLPRATIVCRGGRIESIRAGGRIPAEAQPIDCDGGYIGPGFVDLHVHGGGGADFMDGTEDAVRMACASHLQHGTTTLFPTTTTGHPAEIHAMIAACKSAKSDPQSTIAGVHLYGPYFAPDKVGCHAPAGRREPRPDEYVSYFATGMIRIATCAAELSGAAEFYRAARRRRCLITCGHSNATFPEMLVAHRAGVRHVDHFWCAMSSITSLKARCAYPLQASIAEFVLQHPSMSTEVIADGWHLSNELLEFARVMLGPQRLCLVSDASRALDCPAGQYRFGHFATGTKFDSDGKVGRGSDGGLASSVQGLDHMVRHFAASTNATLPEVIRMASLTPAERAGVARHVGSLEIGKQANLLVLDRKLRIQRVFLRAIEITGSPMSERPER